MATASPSLRRVNHSLPGRTASGTVPPVSSLPTLHGSSSTSAMRSHHQQQAQQQLHPQSSHQQLLQHHSHQHQTQQQPRQQQQHHQHRRPTPHQHQHQHQHQPTSLVNSLMREAAEGVDVGSRVDELKRAILTDGVESDDTGMSSHRIYIWLLLLRAPVLPYEEYAALLRRGASPAYAKINDDTHRTLATDPLFARRVSQNSIARLLNTIAWRLGDDEGSPESTALPPSPPSGSPASPAEPAPVQHPSLQALARAPSVATLRASASTLTLTPPAHPHAIPLPPSPRPPGPAAYVQGMNVLAAPLLYAARSEPQAHALLHTLLTAQVPAYVSPTMAGVHAGLALLDRCLALLDPALHAHLAAKGLTASLYAFPSILTLSACTPPLPEVLRLWDFLFAWGVHLNVLAVVAQLHLMRERLLGSDSPAKDLRSLGPLRAAAVIDLVLVFVARVPADLFAELVAHTGGQEAVKR